MAYVKDVNIAAAYSIEYFVVKAGDKYHANIREVGLVSALRIFAKFLKRSVKCFACLLQYLRRSPMEILHNTRLVV